MKLFMEGEEEGQSYGLRIFWLKGYIMTLTFLYNFALVKEFVHLLSQARPELGRASPMFKWHLLFILQTRKGNE